jgi:hypothetical protein
VPVSFGNSGAFVFPINGNDVLCLSRSQKRLSDFIAEEKSWIHDVHRGIVLGL